MENQYEVGQKVQVNYYKETKSRSTSFHAATVKGILPNGVLQVEFDSRRGDVERIKMTDILKKQTRLCTLNVKEGSYKEDPIIWKKKSMKHVYTSQELWEVEEVLDNRKYNNHVEFLIKWMDRPASENMWQRRNMLSEPVQEEGNALIKRKLWIGLKKKREEQRKIKKESRIKKEHE